MARGWWRSVVIAAVIVAAMHRGVCAWTVVTVVPGRSGPGSVAVVVTVVSGLGCRCRSVSVSMSVVPGRAAVIVIIVVTATPRSIMNRIG